MTEEEAGKIIAIMLTADGGCHVCGHDLLEQFSKAFPAFSDLAKKAYFECHDIKMMEEA